MDLERTGGPVFVRLLGRPEVRWSGGSEPLLSDMPRRLLAYVAARGGEVSRSEAAALLWPEHEDARRRGNLRRLLGRTRELPFAVALRTDRDRIRWPVASDLALVEAGDGSDAERAALLEQTLLAGIEVDDDDGLADWLDHERERLARLRRRLLVAHARARWDAGDAIAAAATFERLVDEEPLDEEALQHYLSVAAAADAAPRARAAYRRFVSALERDLGLTPLDATRRLAAALGGNGDPPAGQMSVGPNDGRASVAAGAAVPSFDGPIVGRSSAIARLRAARRSILVVTGEPGVGKTAALRAASEGATTVWLRAQDAVIERPFASVAAGLREWARTADVSALERLGRKERAALAQLAPFLVDGGRGDERVVDPAEGRGRLVVAAAHALRRAVGHDGYVLVDDLHRLDVASVDVVAALVRDGATAPTGPRVLATARPIELETAPGRGALERLEGDGLIERLPLEPWTEDELEALLTELAAGPVPRRFTRRLHAATGGNALFVMETLRHAFVGGHVRSLPSGGWSTAYDESVDDGTAEGTHELPLPPTVRDAVRERVARLDGGTRRLLEAASLAVPPFTLERIAPATALSEWLALDALESAVAAGLLVANADGYRFGHDLVRRAVADGMGGERRSLIERRLAWSLERDRGSPGLIAAHFERAGRRGDAYRWHRLAAEEATALYVPAVAIEHLERAATLAEHDRDRVDVHLAWAALLDRTVDPKARETVLEGAREAAERLGDAELETRVAVERMRAALDLGRADVAHGIGERARARARGSPAAAELHLVLARVAVRSGDTDAAERELDLGAATLPEGNGELRGRYHLEGRLACAHLRGDHDAAVGHADAALEVFAAIGHRELLAEATNYQGILLALAGRIGEAIERLEVGLELAREVGHVAVQRRALLNLIKLYTDRADVDAAAPLVAEGLALAHDFEQRTTEVAFVLADGYVRYLRGDLGGAARAFDRAIDVADVDGNAIWRVHARLIAATPSIHAGARDEASAYLQGAATIVDEHGLEHLRARLDARMAALALAANDPSTALDIVGRWRDAGQVPAEERGELTLLEAAALAATGHHAEALEVVRACADAPTLEVRVAAEVLVLEATMALGGPATEALRVVQARIDDGRVPPFEMLDLLRAAASAFERAGDLASADASRADADAREMRLRSSRPSLDGVVGRQVTVAGDAGDVAT